MGIRQDKLIQLQEIIGHLDAHDRENELVLSYASNDIVVLAAVRVVHVRVDHQVLNRGPTVRALRGSRA